MNVHGKRVLLTGASSGIGRALARELGGKRSRLAIAARQVNLLEDVAGEIERAGGARPAVLGTDLANRGEAARLARRAVEELGAIDVLVNNAGGGAGGTQWMVGDRDEAREMFEVNYWSPLALIQELVPPMRERGEGAVVNVTSLAQVTIMGGLGHYCSSKAALARATEALRLEGHGSGVQVLEAIVGPTDTAIQGESRLVPGFKEATRGIRLGKPEELARLIVRALERGKMRLVYPRMLAPTYTLPFIARAYEARLAVRLAPLLDTEDPRVMRGGSFGDEEARAARAAWEREKSSAR
jgi:uncharacterized protein